MCPAAALIYGLLSCTFCSVCESAAAGRDTAPSAVMFAAAPPPSPDSRERSPSTLTASMADLSPDI